MENPPTEESYQETKARAQKLYKKLNRVWCSVLGGYVSFYKSGFRHLMWKGNMPRPKSEQRRRFALLPYIENILKDSATVVIYEENDIEHVIKVGVQRIAGLAKAKFWRLIAIRDGKTIKIVVRQIENNEKHFFSIFERKQKATS